MSVSRPIDMNCINLTTRPQLAGARKIPKGWDNIRALRGGGPLLVGSTRRTVAAAVEDSWSHMAVRAFGKSTDHALRPDNPKLAKILTCATIVSWSCGWYVSPVSAVEFTYDLDRSSATRYLAPFQPRCSAMQNMGDIASREMSVCVTCSGLAIQPFSRSIQESSHHMAFSAVLFIFFLPVICPGCVCASPPVGWSFSSRQTLPSAQGRLARESPP